MDEHDRKLPDDAFFGENLYATVDYLVRERFVDYDTVLEVLQSALERAANQVLGSESSYEAQYSGASGKFELFRVLEVTDDPKNSSRQIAPDDPRMAAFPDPGDAMMEHDADEPMRNELYSKKAASSGLMLPILYLPADAEAVAVPEDKEPGENHLQPRMVGPELVRKADDLARAAIVKLLKARLY
jgi:NusA N-terminal domain